MILALNTSTPQFGMALMHQSGAVIAEHFMTPGSKYFGSFMPTLDDLIRTTKSDLKEIQALAVTTGPGSFTGLRVGLSAAKGISQGLNIPILGVSSLEALANQAPYSNCPVCPIIDSRRGEFFVALFDGGDIRNKSRLKEDACLRFEDLPSLFRGQMLFIGNDYVKQSPEIEKIFGQDTLLAPAHLWNIKASEVGVLGLRRFQKKDFDDLRDLMPAYMRPPDIRPNPYPLRSQMPISST